MSTAFREFLRQRAEKYQAEMLRGKATLDEWTAAIERLFGQIRAWLGESDPDGAIEIKEGRQEITERGLGRYHVPRLDLNAFGKWIGIIPKARKTVGIAIPPQKSAPERASGRVDITDELRRYVLFRFLDENNDDIWLIDDFQSEPKAFEKVAFERAIMSYLQ